MGDAGRCERKNETRGVLQLEMGGRVGVKELELLCARVLEGEKCRRRQPLRPQKQKRWWTNFSPLLQDVADEELSSLKP